MVPSILSGARVRHLRRRDELTDRLMAAGFVAAVFLSACTDALGQVLPELHSIRTAATKGADHAR